MAKKDKNKKPAPPLQEKLNEEAGLRLKKFIDDLRHDPMFKHRLFYPVLYKEIVRGREYLNSKDNKVQAPVVNVMYEYYLLKMEKFGNKKTASIFQAILYANGPMLPENERFIITDSGNANSILNPRNMNTVIHRTKVFLDVLKDENLFNFVFLNTVGQNLNEMRERFRRLVQDMHDHNGDNIVNRQIDNRLSRNLQAFRDYFEHVSTQDIREVVNFLIYMGNPRTIVTDFSYRPMPQDMLEDYLSYGMNEQQTFELEFMNQLEQALDSNVLQKDLEAQLDVFIPMLLKTYTSICVDNMNLICMSKKDFQKNIRHDLPLELKNNLKLKLQRSIKQIIDYTRNYITRHLLNDQHGDDLFISRVLRDFNQQLRDEHNNNRSVSDLARNSITYLNFTSSRRDDLSNLIYTIFKNDIEYIIEICGNKEECENTKNKISSIWSAAKYYSAGGDSSLSSHEAAAKKACEQFKKSILKILKLDQNCYEKRSQFAKKTDILINEYVARKGLDDSIFVQAYIKADKDFKHLVQKILDELEKEADFDFAKFVTESLYKFVKEGILKFIDFLHSKSIAPDDEHALIYELIYTIYYIIRMLENLRIFIASIEKSIDHDECDIERIITVLQVLVDVESTLTITLKHVFETTYKRNMKDIIKDTDKDFLRVYDEIIKFISHIDECLKFDKTFHRIIKNSSTTEEASSGLDHVAANYREFTKHVDTDELASELLELYFKYYLRPVLINFFGYAFDNFEFATRRNDIEADIVSKDILHFSKLLTPKNVGLFTIDGAALNDLAKFTYILTSDTFSGITFNNPDSVINFLNNVYGIKYFNLIVYGHSDAYVYFNNIGAPYLYRGAKTKIPIRELQKNYEFLMDPSRGLYHNILLPKKKK